MKADRWRVIVLPKRYCPDPAKIQTHVLASLRTVTKVILSTIFIWVNITHMGSLFSSKFALKVFNQQHVITLPFAEYCCLGVKTQLQSRPHIHQKPSTEAAN